MNTIKCFSLLIASTFLSTAVFSQNATAPVAELDVKPVTAKPTATNIPAPGTRVVATEPIDAIKPTQPIKPFVQAPVDAALVAPSPLNKEDNVIAKNVPSQKLVAKAIPAVDAKQMQPKMTEEMKATMAGKTVRPKSIDQSTGATEGKLTPVKVITLQATPVIAPIIEN